MNETQLIQTMKTRAEAVQAVVTPVIGMADVIRYTVDLAAQRRFSTVGASGLGAENTDELIRLGNAVALDVLTPPFRNHMSGIHIGLTPADRGIAETGTLVLDSAFEDVRIITMLSEIHIAFLHKSLIVEDMMSLAESMNGLMKAPPSYMAFITGPSRTADIERVLTIGVHGPQELHILITEEDYR
jgi:L-lactate dehydrogenase complex protein LldG